MERIVFYAEWLQLPKKDFRIMAMLADVGEFKGNLSDLCRYFSLSPQQTHRTALRASIEQLYQQGLLQREREGRSYTLRAIPKGTEIQIPRQWLIRLKGHDYTSESVAWEQVLKVLLWIVNNRHPVVTNDQISNDLQISVSTIGCAKNVLQYEYEAITRRKVSEKISDDCFRTIGQELAAGAWWST